jgi:hypothetical protein
MGSTPRVIYVAFTGSSTEGSDIIEVATEAQSYRRPKLVDILQQMEYVQEGQIL